VNLQSDHIPREAGPDARIHGRGAYQTTDADGRVRSGDLYDASLRYEQEKPREKTVAEILYDNPTSWPQPIRLSRKDGVAMTREELLYPTHYTDEDYVMGFRDEKPI
jgi:hypothetical protein